MTLIAPVAMVKVSEPTEMDGEGGVDTGYVRKMISLFSSPQNDLHNGIIPDLALEMGFNKLVLQPCIFTVVGFDVIYELACRLTAVDAAFRSILAATLFHHFSLDIHHFFSSFQKGKPRYTGLSCIMLPLSLSLLSCPHHHLSCSSDISHFQMMIPRPWISSGGREPLQRWPYEAAQQSINRRLPTNPLDELPLQTPCP